MLSQEQLAHLAGVHRTYVGRIERGETGVTVESLARLLAPLDVSLEEFFRSWGHAETGRGVLLGRSPRELPKIAEE
jgi:transcriptional regulator with XRE-family HTH domain